MKPKEIAIGKDLTVVQELLCQDMDAVHKVCQENGIVYYLIGGSALGAVRHQGFIPWDSEADLRRELHGAAAAGTAPAAGGPDRNPHPVQIRRNDHWARSSDIPPACMTCFILGI